MAYHPHVERDETLPFARQRVNAILAALEAAAGGEYTKLPLSGRGDELDAIAHAVNVLLDELQTARKGS